MNESKITTRYAKAIFELAQENGILEKVNSDFDLVRQALDIEQFRQLLDSPVIPVSRKKMAVTELLKSKVHPYVLDFLLLVIDNKREIFLKQILLDYYQLYKKALGITEVELTTATEIDDKLRNEFIDVLKKTLNTKIDLHHKIKPGIIGGFILRVEDRLLDVSVASQLKLIRKELTK